MQRRTAQLSQRTCSVMGTSPSAPRIVTRDATVCGSVSRISLAAAAAAQLHSNNKDFKEEQCTLCNAW
jgi:hypothetical protein